MVIFPNAKINIGLNILRKREDGYHEIETLFYPIGWKDALEYVVNGGNAFRFESSGLQLAIDPEQNMVAKAYRMLQVECKVPGLDVHLHKAIPSGAGLGGGSSDAAFFLKSLNEHFELGLAMEKLKSMAVVLGADCPFFLENIPALATGIGDQLTPAKFSLRGYFLLLVKPPFGVDTKLAYAGVTPKIYPFDFEEILLGGMSGWEETIKNDFEPTLFAKFPELAVLKEQLNSMNPDYVSMSGSGSSVYALFEQEPQFQSKDFPPGSQIWMDELNRKNKRLPLGILLFFMGNS